MEYRDMDFGAVELEIAGHTFIDCHFKGTIFKYSGGPALFRGCDFGSVTWRIEGELRDSLDLLRTFARLGGPKKVKALADTLSAFIRAKSDPTTITIA